MKTTNSMIVTETFLDQDGESRTCGLVVVTAQACGDNSDNVESTVFLGGINDGWKVGDKVFVTVQTESDGDWLVNGAEEYDPGPK